MFLYRRNWEILMGKSMNINQGEIWMVNFEPSAGSEIQKLGPAIVVNDDRIGRFGIKIVVPITQW